MNKSPAFQIYVKQWLGDDKVMLMDWDAKGMHFHLMCVAWQQNPQCSIPDDQQIIKKWVGSPSQKDWDRIWPQISMAWEHRDGRFFQKGLERSMIRQRNYSSANKKNVLVRWENNTKKDTD